jgi:adenylylsulfate kinase
MNSQYQRNAGFILWFTGMSGAGKSTLSQAVYDRLREGLGEQFIATGRIELLDGDEVRTHLSKGLSFSKADRDTNIRRIGFVSRLLARNGVIVITAAISPYREIRAEVRRLAAAEKIPFVEVYVEAELEVLIDRDTKGLYKKAIAGEIKDFTGISAPYEAPENPEIHIRSDRQEISESVDAILSQLIERELIERKP